MEVCVVSSTLVPPLYAECTVWNQAGSNRMTDGTGC